jgi:hypothetical protein
VRCGGGRWREMMELTSLISIQYVIIICNDVTRAKSRGVRRSEEE